MRDGDTILYHNAKTSKKRRLKQESELKRKKQREQKPFSVRNRPNNEYALFHLLNSSKSVYNDNKSVIEAIKRYPEASKRHYEFQYHGERCRCYPFHQAIKIGATFDVLNALYMKFPMAVKELSDFWCDTSLHIAITYRSSPQVVSFLLEKWPGALKVRNQYTNQPLHDAIVCRAPMEVISLLVHKWPAGIKEEGEFLATPLHLACGRNESFELISLLVNKCPDAVKKKDECGMTPLHFVCLNNASMEYVLCLLEKWPEAVKEEDECGETPLLIAKRNSAPASIQKVFSFVFHLCGNEVNGSVANEAMNFFIEIKWYGGVALVLDRYPAIVQTFHVNMKAFPALLSFVGRFCNMSSLWGVISNQQELLVNV